MIRLLLVAQFLFASSALLAHTTATRITVRAISRDAKVIGDGVGGARITIREVETGKVLASGIQSGGTGDTTKIMREPRNRVAQLYDTEGAASFRATLALAHPTRVEIIAEGPLKYPQAMQRVSKTMLLIPGRHIEGEGVLLEIHGFIVEITSPAPGRSGQRLDVRARVTMTCGCPTEPGGLWNADRIEVTLRALRDGKIAAETVMSYAGETSTFKGSLPPLPSGKYAVEVLASDAQAVNFGRAVQRHIVE